MDLDEIQYHIGQLLQTMDTVCRHVNTTETCIQPAPGRSSSSLQDLWITHLRLVETVCEITKLCH